MAERNGPEESGNGPDAVEPGQQDDRAELGADRLENAPAENAADEVTEHDNRETVHDAAADSGADGIEAATADVVPFRLRAETEEDTALEDDLGDLDEDDGEPIDLSELQSDDALLDALGGTDPAVPTTAEGAAPTLESLLVSWRREVDAAPIGDLVDLDTAVATIAAGQRPKRRLRRWHLVPVASAAAVLMIMSTGVGLAAREALPGDMLWSVAQVLYSDHARAAQAHDDAQQDLERAQAAWDDGYGDQAEGWLDSAEQHMQDVDAEHGLAGLKSTHESLAAEFGDVVNPPDDSSSLASSEFPTATSVPPPSSTSSEFPTETESSTPTTSEESSDTSVPTETTDSTSTPASGTSQHDSGFLVPTD